MYGYSNPCGVVNVDICWLVDERRISVEKVTEAGVLEIAKAVKNESFDINQSLSQIF